jgi:hypothetical protein
MGEGPHTSECTRSIGEEVEVERKKAKHEPLLAYNHDKKKECLYYKVSYMN